MKYETGIILSGGGARGYAHAGILKALNESGIHPDVISGVSAGAIVGALYADGKTPEEIYEIFGGDNSIFQYVRLSVPKSGFLRAAGLRENLSRYLGSKTFEDLKLPLYIAATDLNRGEVVYFNSGEILDKVIASASIPLLFEPVKIEDHYYVDGGVMDSFPVSPIQDCCRRLIGISLNPIHPENDFRNMFRIAERTFRLTVSSNISPKIKQCEMVFEPGELGKYGLLDTTRGKEMYEMGYKSARKTLNS
ncbi:MAG: patatin-like phospholipase family protein [Bacteroidales bacterium]